MNEWEFTRDRVTDLTAAIDKEDRCGEHVIIN